MHNKSHTIAVFGLFGSPNLGNEATLAAFLQNMQPRLPNVRILLIAPRSFTIDQTYGVCKLDTDPMPVDRAFWRVKPARLKHFFEALATIVTEPRRRRRVAKLLDGVEAFFIPGTGVVDDFGQGPFDMPLHLDRWTAAATRVGARVVFCSIGAATVRNPLSRWLFRRSLKRASYCSFRDVASSRNAGALGCTSSIVVPDLAFSLREESQTQMPEWPPRTIGIGVMGYFGWNQTRANGMRTYRRYVEKIDRLIQRLAERGYTMRLLIGDVASDAGAARDVAEFIRAPDRAGSGVVPEISTYRDLISQIALCDIVVATRYHNVVFALMAGRPTISIGYSDKNDSVMQSFGQDAYCHAIETFDVDTVVAQVNHLAAGSSLSTPLRSQAALIRQQVVEQYRSL